MKYNHVEKMNSFNAVYGAQVDAWIAKNTIYSGDRIFGFKINDTSLYTKKANNYIMPRFPEGVIMKPYAAPLIFAIKPPSDNCRVKIFNDNYLQGFCSCLGNPLRYFYKGQGWCYVEREDRHPDAFHITDYNPLDWVEFMSESKRKYYVNCNPENMFYKNIMAVWGENTGWGDNPITARTVGHVDTFIHEIELWLQKPNKFLFELSLYRYFLNSVYSKGNPVLKLFKQIDVATFGYILEHKNDVWEYSEAVIERYLELLRKVLTDPITKTRFRNKSEGRIRKFANKTVKRLAGQRMFSDSVVHDIESRLAGLQIDPKNSFYDWLVKN